MGDVLCLKTVFVLKKMALFGFFAVAAALLLLLQQETRK